MNGHNEQAVVRIAAATSGRAILVSGLTVMVSLAGLFLTGIDIFTGHRVRHDHGRRRGRPRLAVLPARRCCPGSGRGLTAASCPISAAA